MTEPFAPDHLEFFATVTLSKHRYDADQVRDWLNELVETVEMQVLMPSTAMTCDDLGNEGTSGIVMLKTSHSSIHIWDQCDTPYAKLVLYSCKPFPPEPILDMLRGLGARVCAWEIRDRNHQTEDDLLSGHMYSLIAAGTVDYRDSLKGEPMANFKRTRSRRQVRCTLGTMYRWMGNNGGRSRRVLSRHRDRQKMLNQIKYEAAER